MIEFGRILVVTNSIEFLHGTDMVDFRSLLTWPNFGQDRLGQIRSNFGYGSLNQIFVGADSDEYVKILFKPDLVKICSIHSNFVPDQHGRLWPNLG